MGQVTQLGLAELSGFIEVKKTTGEFKYYAVAYEQNFELTQEQYCMAMLGKLKFIEVEIPNNER